MPLFATLADLRKHVETELDDAALSVIVNAEEAAIEQRAGPVATATEYFPGGVGTLWLSRAPSAITTVTVDGVELDAARYALVGRSALRSLAGLWGRDVTVTYVPEDTTAQRRLVLVQLVKLALAYSGFSSLRLDGHVSEQPLAYTQERERLLSMLGSGRTLFV
jgi:hypothetical protein